MSGDAWRVGKTVFGAGLCVTLWCLTPCAWADTYKVHVEKDGADAEADVEHAEKPEWKSTDRQERKMERNLEADASGDTLTPTQLEITAPDQRRRHHGHPGYEEGYAYEEEGLPAGPPPVPMLFGQVWVGVSALADRWVAPFPTRFETPSGVWWDRHPVLTLWGGTLNARLPMQSADELDFNVGFLYGTAETRSERPEGYVVEECRTGVVLMGADYHYGVAGPFFLSAGINGWWATTDFTLTTDVSQFTYDGFALDSAGAFGISAGAGVTSPQAWLLRLELSVKAYVNLTFEGPSTGVRAGITALPILITKSR